MRNTPLLFTDSEDGSGVLDGRQFATKNQPATPAVPHLTLIPGQTPEAISDERTAQLARLGLLVEQLGTTEALARLGGNQADIPVHQLRVWTREYIQKCETLLQTKATVNNKKGAFERFFAWLDAGGYEICNRQVIEQFIDHIATGHEAEGGRWGKGDDDPDAARYAKPVTAHTIKFYRDHLRALFNWAVSRGYVTESPVTGIQVPKPSKSLKVPFSTEQVDALIRVARDSTMPLRDEAIYTFLYDTGLRATEFCNIRLGDIVLKERSGTVRVLGKGNKERIVPFNHKARTCLWRYLQEAPITGSDKVFIGERGWRKGRGLTRHGLLQLFERHGELAGITGVRCSPHTMRHTFAFKFLKNGGNIRTLSYLLGHESLHMTMIYLHVHEADAEAQHAQFSPADTLDD